jgi:hypothetical protein
MFLKRGAIKYTAYYSFSIENKKGDIGNCQPSFARVLGVVGGLILAIHLMRCPTTSCRSDGKV